MIARVGTTAFGPPAKTRTGKEVRTIARLRRADLRTMLRRLGAGDSFSLPGNDHWLRRWRVHGILPAGESKMVVGFRTVSGAEPSDRTLTLSFVCCLPLTDHSTIDLYCNALLSKVPYSSKLVVCFDFSTCRSLKVLAVSSSSGCTARSMPKPLADRLKPQSGVRVARDKQLQHLGKARTTILWDTPRCPEEV